MYRRGYSRRSKVGEVADRGGKAVAEFAGPVRFGGWDAAGQPVGVPWGGPGDPLPWVQVAAVSEGQTDNTWSVVYYFLTENDGELAEALRVDAGLARCFLQDKPGAKLEPVTASAGSRQPITYRVLGETHLWTPRNGGVKLARRSAGTSRRWAGRRFETTNKASPVKGLWLGSHRSGAGRCGWRTSMIVRPPREVGRVPVTLDTPDGVLLRAALSVAYGCLVGGSGPAGAGDPRPGNEVAGLRQFFFNWNTKGGGLAVDGEQWAKLADPIGRGGRGRAGRVGVRRVDLG